MSRGSTRLRDLAALTAQRSADACAKPARQSEGRGRRPSGGALDSGALARQRFFTLAELNAAIAALVEDLNARPMRKLGVSRRELFERLDQPALSSLPSEPLCMPNGASVAWRWITTSTSRGSTIGATSAAPRAGRGRVTARTIELFHKGERVAVHVRAGARGRRTTLRSTCPGASAACRVDDRADRREATAIGPRRRC